VGIKGVRWGIKSLVLREKGLYVVIFMGSGIKSSDAFKNRDQCMCRQGRLDQSGKKSYSWPCKEDLANIWFADIFTSKFILLL